LRQQIAVMERKMKALEESDADVNHASAGSQRKKSSG
jgi:hypothetical protein